MSQQDTNCVSGGTGYLASALIPRLKGNIRILARNEGLLVKHRELGEIITGDIANEWIVKKSMKGANKIWHLAAIKGVDIAETQTFACAMTNIVGTINLLKESFKTKPELFVFISTDKASQVNGVYGASKMIGERLVREAERINPATKYRVVRYGNVIGSTGSFLPKWIEKIKNGQPIQITDTNMTRFFFTKEQAVDLIFECLEKAIDSTPYIPQMKSMRMGDIAEAVMQKYGRVPIEIIGNRGGENTSETMDGVTFSDQVEQYSIEEIKQLI